MKSINIISKALTLLILTISTSNFAMKINKHQKTVRKTSRIANTVLYLQNRTSKNINIYWNEINFNCNIKRFDTITKNNFFVRPEVLLKQEIILSYGTKPALFDSSKRKSSEVKFYFKLQNYRKNMFYICFYKNNEIVLVPMAQ